MASLVHGLWQALPHASRRQLFDHAVLRLGRFAASGSAARSKGPIIVAGALRSPTGLGQAARLLLAGLQSAGLEVAAIDLTAALRQPEDIPLPDVPAACAGGGTVIVVLTPPVSSYALWTIGRGMLAGKRLVAHWVWEYPRIPAQWHRHAAFFHDLLAPTAHGASAFSSLLGRKVGLLPYPVALQDHWKDGSARHPDGVFRVGFTGDLVAAAGRKNPLACVEAVVMAFPDDASVELSLVLAGGTPDHPVRQALERHAAALKVRLVIDPRTLGPREHAARFNQLDAYLSLHRAEGFGLTITEAMLAGIPCIATGAPPMDDIMPAHAGFPVPWQMDEAPALVDLASPGHWSAPDIAAAANALRSLRADPALARAVGARGRAHVLAAFGADAFARNLASTLPD
jgi:glycosyltransferase involved in cell wall biosynthesis